MPHLSYHHGIWLVLIVLVLWGIKIVVFYHFLTWLSTTLRPRYYALKRRVYRWFGKELPEREPRPLSEEDFAVLLKAINFATLRHRDQKRRDLTGTPYINHPLHVLDILYRVGKVRDVHILSGAVLHGILRSKKSTYQELVAEFGPEIARIVLEVTDDQPSPPDGAKSLQSSPVVKKSEQACIVIVADNIAHVEDMSDTWDAQRKREYIDTVIPEVDKARGYARDLELLFDQTVAQEKAKLK